MNGNREWEKRLMGFGEEVKELMFKYIEFVVVRGDSVFKKFVKEKKRVMGDFNMIYRE